MVAVTEASSPASALDHRILLESLQVCRNMIDASMQLHDRQQSRAMMDTTWELLLSVHRLRRATGLPRDAEVEFNEAAMEVEVGLDRCRLAIERRA